MLVYYRVFEVRPRDNTAGVELPSGPASMTTRPPATLADDRPAVPKVSWPPPEARGPRVWCRWVFWSSVRWVGAMDVEEFLWFSKMMLDKGIGKFSMGIGEMCY